MAIEDLTNPLMMHEDHGVPDLALSETARDQYVALIADYRRELQAQRDEAARIHALSYPGHYVSAQQMQKRLELDVIGIDGLVPTLDKMLEYLDEFEAKVNATSGAILADDQST